MSGFVLDKEIPGDGPEFTAPHTGRTVQADNQEVQNYAPSPRDKFEQGLEELFKEKIIPVEKAGEIIAKYKDGSFAMSQVGMMLYTNGTNLRGISHKHPNGMIYYDGENIFGVGYFAKEGETNCHPHIVAPKGPDAVKKVDDIIAQIRQAGLSQESVYVRHLADDEKAQFIEKGYATIDTNPWHPDAPEEDETYSNKMINLDDLIGTDQDGNPVIKNLPDTPEFTKFKEKSRLAMNRFNHFLDDNKMTFKLDLNSYSETEKEVTDALVNEFFEGKRKFDDVVGSSPEDYSPLIQSKPEGENGKDYFSYIAKVVDQSGFEIPVGCFVAEKTAPDKVGFYCTISNRFDEYFNDKTTGPGRFTAVSQYCHMNVFMEFYKAGIKKVDIGGSETWNLNDFKKRMGAREEGLTHWVVKP